ncbi:hypothetical protein F8388_017603, partial [Cannabis sativa]
LLSHSPLHTTVENLSALTEPSPATLCLDTTIFFLNLSPESPPPSSSITVKLWKNLTADMKRRYF